MLIKGAAAAVALSVMAGAAAAQPAPVRMGAAQSPIATAVRIPAGSQLVYVSGTVPDPANPDAPSGSAERWGNTEAQTRSVLGKIEKVLAEQGMGLGDVVMMRVFLVAPPGQQAMDFGGMMKAYSERFGTTAQPRKPARSTMEVAGLVDPAWLVEIEVTAAGAPKQPK
jgi:enamine deaminase RidA (YjgF/YER057c/UK114 family)